MAQIARPTWERGLVRVAGALVFHEWRIQHPEDAGMAALAAASYGERQSTRISCVLRRGTRPTGRALDFWKGICPAAGVLLNGWIPALSPSTNLKDLRGPMADALRRLRIEDNEIEHLCHKDASRWPTHYPHECLWSEVVVQLVFLRRLHVFGPVFLELLQAWHASAALIRCAVDCATLRPLACDIWDAVMANLVCDCESAERLGSPSPLISDDVQRKQRHLEFRALERSVSSVLAHQQSPTWVCPSVRPDFNFSLAALCAEHSTQKNPALPVKSCSQATVRVSD